MESRVITPSIVSVSVVHLYCVPALVCWKTGRCDWHTREQGENELGARLHLILQTVQFPISLRVVTAFCVCVDERRVPTATSYNDNVPSQLSCSKLTRRLALVTMVGGSLARALPPLGTALPMCVCMPWKAAYHFKQHHFKEFVVVLNMSILTHALHLGASLCDVCVPQRQSFELQHRGGSAGVSVCAFLKPPSKLVHTNTRGSWV